MHSPLRGRPRSSPAWLALAVLAAAALAALVAGCAGGLGANGLDATSFDGRSPATPPGRTLRVLVAMPRPSLAEVMAKRTLSPDAQRAYVDSLRREQFALRGSLKAKGIGVHRIESFSRVWDGFAATIRTAEFPKLQTAGVRARPVRRFFPATINESSVAKVSKGAKPRRSNLGTASQPRIALLDSGVGYRSRLLGGGIGRRYPVVGGYDVVSNDGDPAPGHDPHHPTHREQHGTELAELLVGRTPGARPQSLLPAGGLYAVRISGLQADPEAGERTEYATTDQLIAGFERVVDPSGDGAVTDRIGVALVGVNAPYSGFERSPEAQAVAGATSLGTTVVAPVGNEGPTGGRFGSVGSPAAAPKALAVGGLVEPVRIPFARLGLVGRDGVVTIDAPLLSPPPSAALNPKLLPASLPHGPSQANPKEPLDHLPGATTAADLTAVDGTSKVSGAVAVLERRGSLAAQVTSAIGAGARVIVICNPQSGAVLPGVAAGVGTVPVLGLSGGAARDALAAFDRGGLPAAGRGRAYMGTVEWRQQLGDVGVAQFSSRGPDFGFGVKPDLIAPSAAVLDSATAGPGIDVAIRGTSVAAARVAAAAVGVHELHRQWSAEQVAALLLADATQLAASQPFVDGAGLFGTGRPTAAGVAADRPIVAVPGTISMGFAESGAPWQRSAQIALRNTTAVSVALTAKVQPRGQPGTATVVVNPQAVTVPANAVANVTVNFSGGGAGGHGPVQGYIDFTGGSQNLRVPYGGFAGPAVKQLLGALRLTRNRGRIRGTRFVLGRFSRTDFGQQATIEPVERLDLELIRPNGHRVRLLTPPGGAPELLPGEYAYTLDRSTLGDLPQGAYRFRARALSPDGVSRQVEQSEIFKLR